MTNEEIAQTIIEQSEATRSVPLTFLISRALLEADKNGYERGRKEGIEEAAKEVETHWNSFDQMTNQKAQALRSAAAIRRLAPSVGLSDVKEPQ